MPSTLSHRYVAIPNPYPKIASISWGFVEMVGAYGREFHNAHSAQKLCRLLVTPTHSIYHTYSNRQKYTIYLAQIELNSNSMYIWAAKDGILQ